jgi:hypothetical protein
MYPRILTGLERKQAKAYLKQDGERTLNIQVLVSRARNFTPQIKGDLDLLEKLVAAYDSHIKKD